MTRPILDRLISKSSPERIWGSGCPFSKLNPRNFIASRSIWKQVTVLIVVMFVVGTVITKAPGAVAKAEAAFSEVQHLRNRLNPRATSRNPAEKGALRCPWQARMYGTPSSSWA
jgi:hypothetical protein